MQICRGTGPVLSGNSEGKSFSTAQHIYIFTKIGVPNLRCVFKVRSNEGCIKSKKYRGRAKVEASVKKAKQLASFSIDITDMKGPRQICGECDS